MPILVRPEKIDFKESMAFVVTAASPIVVEAVFNVLIKSGRTSGSVTTVFKNAVILLMPVIILVLFASEFSFAESSQVASAPIDFDSFSAISARPGNISNTFVNCSICLSAPSPVGIFAAADIITSRRGGKYFARSCILLPRSGAATVTLVTLSPIWIIDDFSGILTSAFGINPVANVATAPSIDPKAPKAPILSLSILPTMLTNSSPMLLISGGKTVESLSIIVVINVILAAIASVSIVSISTPPIPSIPADFTVFLNWDASGIIPFVKAAIPVNIPPTAVPTAPSVAGSVLTFASAAMMPVINVPIAGSNILT